MIEPVDLPTVSLVFVSVRKVEDTHLAKHDVRSDLQPIRMDVKTVEERTNGPISAEFKALGERLEVVENGLAEAGIAGQRCGACGALMPSHATFCPKCGVLISARKHGQKPEVRDGE